MSEKDRGAEITLATFKSPVSIGGEWHSIDYWSRDKHGAVCDCTERGNWLILTLKRDGSTRRIPIANVGYLAESPQPEQQPAPPPAHNKAKL